MTAILAALWTRIAGIRLSRDLLLIFAGLATLTALVLIVRFTIRDATQSATEAGRAETRAAAAEKGITDAVEATRAAEAVRRDPAVRRDLCLRYNRADTCPAE
jgi:hypothetical protein